MINFFLIFIWSVFLLYWVISAKGNKKAEYRKEVAIGGMIARFILIAVSILLWVFPLFSFRVFFPGIIIEIIGALLCILGLIFSVWARRALGKNWSANPVEIKREHELITTGPYQWVRHPIYAGVIFALLGTLLLDGRLRVLILFILVTIGMFARAGMEDRLMMKQFPEVYLKYKNKVKSFVPGIF